MRVYSCKVRLSSSRYNEVSKINVTPAEITVLRRLHSQMSAEDQAAGVFDEEAVIDIVNTGEIERTDKDERVRLQALYGLALRKIETVKNIDGLFGPGNPLPTVVHDAEGIVIPDQKIKRVKSAKAKPKAETKSEPDTEPTDDTEDGDDALAELA